MRGAGLPRGRTAGGRVGATTAVVAPAAVHRGRWRRDTPVLRLSRIDHRCGENDHWPFVQTLPGSRAPAGRSLAAGGVSPIAHLAVRGRVGRGTPVAFPDVSPASPAAASTAAACPRPRSVRPVDLRVIAGAVGATTSAPAAGAARPSPVTGVTLRAAEARPGDLFAALAGSRAHGADFAEQALAAGAVAVLTDPEGARRPALRRLPVLVHPRPREVLGAVAALVYGDPTARLSVLGVTGTSGKTTVAHLLEAGLRAAGRPTGLVGTVGTRIDGKDAAQRLHHAGGARPAGAVRGDGRGRRHRRGDGGVEPRARAGPGVRHQVRGGRLHEPVAGPSRLPRRHGRLLRGEGGAVRRPGRRTASCASTTSGASGWLRVARLRSRCPPAGRRSGERWTPPRAPTARRRSPQWPRTARPCPCGCCCRARSTWPTRWSRSPVWTPSACRQRWRRRASRTLAVPGRMQRVEAGQPYLALVDYAHKPAAVAALLDTLRAQVTGRLIVVLGCGGDRDRGKRPLMGAAAASPGAAARRHRRQPAHRGPFGHPGRHDGGRPGRAGPR